MTSSELVGWSFTSWSWPPGRPPAPPPTSEKVAPASLVTQDTSPTPTKKRREGSLGLSRMDLTPERTRFSASLPTCASPSRRAFNLLMTLTHVLPSSALRNTAFLSVRRKMICGGAAGPRGRAQGVSGERGGRGNPPCKFPTLRSGPAHTRSSTSPSIWAWWATGSAHRVGSASGGGGRRRASAPRRPLCSPAAAHRAGPRTPTPRRPAAGWLPPVPSPRPRGPPPAAGRSGAASRSDAFGAIILRWDPRVPEHPAPPAVRPTRGGASPSAVRRRWASLRTLARPEPAAPPRCTLPRPATRPRRAPATAGR